MKSVTGGKARETDQFMRVKIEGPSAANLIKNFETCGDVHHVMRDAAKDYLAQKPVVLEGTGAKRKDRTPEKEENAPAGAKRSKCGVSQDPASYDWLFH